MKFLTDEELESFINQHDYDIRKTGNARWIDQKCTPDVLCIVADCIFEYYQEKGDIEFTSRDIWYSSYAIENVQNVFKKVDVESDNAENEYDKFFQQPIKLLSYAGVLEETKKGRENYYTIVNSDLLQYIAIRERNALNFLNIYITKVLTDSDLYDIFDDFMSNPSKLTYDSMKDGFYVFTKKYTDIGSKTRNRIDAGKTECGRIFTKVINPIAYCKGTKGSQRGTISKDIISFDMLMYNRDNFRDIYANKPKAVSRKEFATQQKFKPSLAFYQYQSNKAKQFLKLFNNTYNAGKSEVYEENEYENLATQMHHIFPASQFPEISGYYENIIALTPNQHFLKAHPNNKTQSINIDYQYICLVAKTGTIQQNLTSINSVKIYEFSKFLFVIHTGLNDESYEEIEDGDYNGILTKLAISYSR